ncbi:PLAC8-domain-containing protein [Aulographum hederae CBS 113979]|uniref:PLAC8-domain-containing protein n=1 Tax=Aulographum hederae CBS 113979 TaxID=1176131 RepID=A0A6G1H9V4_9PEZI|nr:PLAC8-domain-containing protein [Aulographum hederae CBS 113979]
MDHHRHARYDYVSSPQTVSPLSPPTSTPSSDPRFSWQMPIEFDITPPRLQLDTTNIDPCPPRNRSVRRDNTQHRAPDMADQRGNRFSYLATPVEMQEPFFPANPPSQMRMQTIEQSPESPGEQQLQPLKSAQLNHPIYMTPQERSARSPSPYSTSAPTSMNPHPHFTPHIDRAVTPQEQQTRPHPAIMAQYEEQRRQSLQQQQVLEQRRTSLQQQYTNQPQPPYQPQEQQHPPEPDYPPSPRKDSIPTSPGPIPMKPSIPPEGPFSPNTPATATSGTPYTPHATYTPSRPFLNPDTPAQPPHQPGQIAHPNMSVSASSGSKQSWKHSLCECNADVGTCMLGVFAPCVLYGKTAYRLEQKGQKKDPSDLLGWQKVNGSCGFMSAACGLWCLFPLFTRTRIRHTYKLAGSLGGDIIQGCLCCCCTLVQNEREIRDREEDMRRWAGPAQGYQSPEMMTYSSPPR